MDFKEEDLCYDSFHLYNHLVVSFPFLLLSLLEWPLEMGCAAVSTESHQYYITSVIYITLSLQLYHLVISKQRLKENHSQ